MTIDGIAIGVVAGLMLLIGQLVFRLIGTERERRALRQDETREEVIRITERSKNPGGGTQQHDVMARLDGLAERMSGLAAAVARIEGQVVATQGHHAERLTSLERDRVGLRELTVTVSEAIGPLATRVAALEARK